jgi:hypothetical protein
MKLPSLDMFRFSVPYIFVEPAIALSCALRFPQAPVAVVHVEGNLE